MPLLRKSGVRAPWMPASLPVADTNPPRRMQVVSGWQPVPASSTAWLRTVRETPAPPNTDPLRPLMIAIGQQPTPISGALWLRPPVQPPNTDPLRPMLVCVGAQPVPTGRAAWLLVPKAPNADPLRPLVVRLGQQPLPGAALAWLRAVRETPISALLLPYRRHSYRARAAAAATIPAVGRRFSVPADTESEQL